MKFLILNFLFVFAFGNTNAYVLPTSNAHLAFIVEELPAGVVTVEDINLRVNTGDSAIAVDAIEIFDQSESLVMQVGGCNQQECLVNLSTLAAGTYDVTVTTDSGYTFSGTVTLS